MLLCPFAWDVWNVVKGNIAIELNRKGFISPKQCECSPQLCCCTDQTYVDTIVTRLYMIGANPEHEPTPATWDPPLEGFLMINVDAVMFASLESMGSSMVIRESGGLCCSSPRQVFECACTWTWWSCCCSFGPCLWYGQSYHYYRLPLRGSASRLQGEGSITLCVCAAVIEYIKDPIVAFSSCSMVHVSHVQNVTAHCLACLCAFLCNSMWCAWCAFGLHPGDNFYWILFCLNNKAHPFLPKKETVVMYI
jgi:hypothetical protein